ICLFQLVAYAVDRLVTPLPPDFFGYLYGKSGQLEGYAQNSNAFAFQLLMAAAVLVGFRSSASGRAISRWWVCAGLLAATLAFARSRAGLVCALAAAVLAALLPKLARRKRVSMRALGALLIGGIALAALGFAFRGTIDRLVVEPVTLALRPHAAESDALRWE